MILDSRIRGAGLLLGGLALVVLCGCSTYVAKHAELRDDLAAGSYQKALDCIEEASNGDDRLLNLLERGLVLHYADRWDESNASFAEAEELAADLYTRSISEGVFSLVTNDASIAYRATPHEMALIPFYRALNYIYLGQRDEAVVEARKASLLLREVRARIADEDADALDDDAFLAYFSGLIYEWGGDDNDAFIAYRAAADAYARTAGELRCETPPWLGDDLLRIGRRLGFTAEIADLRNQHPDLFPAEPGTAAEPAPPVDPPRGDVVLLLELGYSPHKESLPIDIPIFKNDDYPDRDAWAVALNGRMVSGWSSGADIDYWLRIAVPELVDEPPLVRGARVSAGLPGSHASTVIVEDVAGRVSREFEQGRAKVMVKTIARGLAKYALQEKADEQGKVAGFLANLFGVATEKADTRGWLTLPYAVAMARLSLPPGVHELKFELTDSSGRTVAVETIADVVVRSGERSFISRRAF